MKEKLEKEFEIINNNLSVLPVNNKPNRKKKQDYLNEQISIYKNLLEEVTQELGRRKQNYLNKYVSDKEEKKISDLDINLIRLLDNRVDSASKLNLDYYFYKLGHFYKDDLDKVNEDILSVINIFKSAGVNLTVNDFNYTEVVYTYMKALLEGKENIHEVFDKLFWENSDIVNQIELNFRNLYFKYKKNIDKFILTKTTNKNLDNYLNNREIEYNEISEFKHNDVGYLSKLLLDGKVAYNDLLDKTIEPQINNLLLNIDFPNNYDNLLKLKESLEEYKLLMQYEFIINNFKELYSHKNEYKGLYDKKYSEILKKEKELVKINKSINKKGLMTKKDKSPFKIKRNACIKEIYDLYKELDDLKIKDLIFKCVDDNTTYDEILSLTAINYNYIHDVLKENNEEITPEDIDRSIVEIFNFIYKKDLNIVTNISISEEKIINQLLYDRYRLVYIQLDEEKLNLENIDAYISTVSNIITYYDLKKNNIAISDIDYILSYNKVMEK